nr:hypothetical protein [Providencia rettgeri]
MSTKLYMINEKRRMKNRKLNLLLKLEYINKTNSAAIIDCLLPTWIRKKKNTVDIINILYFENLDNNIQATSVKPIVRPEGIDSTPKLSAFIISIGLLNRDRKFLVETRSKIE